MRLHAQTAAIENGFVFIPKQAPWLAEYLHELATFPNAKHDDQADFTTQALAWINLAAGKPGIIEYYQFEVARMRYEEGTLLEGAAARAGVTIERLKEWVNPNRRNPLIEHYQRTRNALQG